MKRLTIILLFGGLLAFVGCVPAKKYNELLEKQNACSEELNQVKAAALDFESKYKDVEAKHQMLVADVDQLRKDTTHLGNDLRFSQHQYKGVVKQMEEYENQINHLKKQGKVETGNLQGEIDAKTEEILRRQSQLDEMENDLRAKQSLLSEKEKRINELEEIINRKDRAIADIKGRIIEALKPYADKGLSIEEKDGKIYVRLEAKLLFNTGSIEVEPNGKKALVDLAQTLENEKDIDIVVEGHTDTDAIKSPIHPVNNWELSVLRATSVVDIMLKNSKMDPRMLTAAGRSEFFPVDTNDKSKNRRIEIIVSPNLKSLFDLISK